MTSHCQLLRSTWRSFERQPWLLSRRKVSRAQKASYRSSRPFSPIGQQVVMRANLLPSLGGLAEPFTFPCVVSCSPGLGSPAMCVEYRRGAPSWMQRQMDGGWRVVFSCHGYLGDTPFPPCTAEWKTGGLSAQFHSPGVFKEIEPPSKNQEVPYKNQNCQLLLNNQKVWRF